MRYINFDSVASAAAVRDVSNFPNAVPGTATQVELQAVTQPISYTMDGTDPTATAGMQLLVTDPPKAFQIQDFNVIKFIQTAGGAGVLNAHYISGRTDL